MVGGPPISSPPPRAGPPPGKLFSCYFNSLIIFFVDDIRSSSTDSGSPWSSTGRAWRWTASSVMSHIPLFSIAFFWNWLPFLFLKNSGVLHHGNYGYILLRIFCILIFRLLYEIDNSEDHHREDHHREDHHRADHQVLIHSAVEWILDLQN